MMCGNSILAKGSGVCTLRPRRIEDLCMACVCGMSVVAFWCVRVVCPQHHRVCVRSRLCVRQLCTCLSQICKGLEPMLYMMDRKPLWNVFLNMVANQTLWEVNCVHERVSVDLCFTVWTHVCRAHGIPHSAPTTVQTKEKNSRACMHEHIHTGARFRATQRAGMILCSKLFYGWWCHAYVQRVHALVCTYGCNRVAVSTYREQLECACSDAGLLCECVRVRVVSMCICFHLATSPSALCVCVCVSLFSSMFVLCVTGLVSKHMSLTETAVTLFNELYIRINQYKLTQMTQVYIRRSHIEIQQTQNSILRS